VDSFSSSQYTIPYALFKSIDRSNHKTQTMANKIAFIHGYGKSLDPENKQSGSNCGFHIYSEEILRKQHVAFDWSHKKEYSPLAKLNPLAHLRLYQHERRLAHSEQTQRALYDYLQAQSVQAVICHSLGAQLTLNTFAQYSIPPTLHKIILVAADIAHTDRLHFADSCASVQLTNIYCPWDPALITSLCMHQRVPAGLTGLRHLSVKNILYPYHTGINLHQDIWRDRRFKGVLQKLIYDK
jgi:hypothetical protein